MAKNRERQREVERLRETQRDREAEMIDIGAARQFLVAARARARACVCVCVRERESLLNCLRLEARCDAEQDPVGKPCGPFECQ